MDLFDRMQIWKKMQKRGQATDAPPSAADPTAPSATATSPSVVGNAPSVSLSSIPTFRTNLFSLKADSMQDIQSIINLLNTYLFKLSGGKLTFTATWLFPTIGPDAFTNSLKNVYSLAKWIYTVVSINEAPYSIDALKKIATDLKDTANLMDFPDPSATNFKAEIATISQTMLGKLSTS